MLDLWLPDNTEFPVFIYMHGGGISSGKRTDFDHIAEHLVSNGIATVSVDYRMYPNSKYPKFIEDCAATAVG